jgi:hypothetical protein
MNYFISDKCQSILYPDQAKKKQKRRTIAYGECSVRRMK